MTLFLLAVEIGQHVDLITYTYYHTNANSTPPSLEIGDFVYAKFPQQMSQNKQTEKSLGPT